jgi:hypothetical protein
MWVLFFIILYRLIYGLQHGGKKMTWNRPSQEIFSFSNSKFLKLGQERQGNVLRGSMVFLFWFHLLRRENDVTNLALKSEIHCMAEMVTSFERPFHGELETEENTNFELINQKLWISKTLGFGHLLL